MKKRAVLIRKLYRAYNNKKNIEYSKWKGYPEDTYFGYYSFEELKISTLNRFTSFYGKGLRSLRLETL